MKMPDEIIHLLRDNATIGFFATSLHNQPHVTPVWLDYDSPTDQLLIDVESVALKLRHTRVNPYVAISFVSVNDSSHWVSLKGLVVQIDDMSEDAIHLQTQALRYLGRYRNNPGHRFILRIQVDIIRWWAELDCGQDEHVPVA